MERFHQVMRDLEQSEHVTFVSLSQLAVKLTDAQFAEQFHLDYHGAMIFSEALSEKVILPLCGSRWTRTPGADAADTRHDACVMNSH